MTSLNRLGLGRLQQGAALILLVFILAIAMTTYFVKMLDNEALKTERERRDMQNLALAKEALISWAVSNSEHPGQMPYPDRGTDPGGYDGLSDCPMSGTPFNNPLSYRLLIGKLPIYGQTNPCISPQEGLALDHKGEDGKRLWYAVSRNLVHQYEYLTANPLSNPIINSSIVNNPTYQWLRVLDKNGVVISDRVAALIIAPGEVIGNQRRSNTATVDNFLDQFQIGGTIYSNQDYDQPDEDFFIGESLDRINANDLTYTRPYLFNDKLVYVTIDELMIALEKKVAREVVYRLRDYFNVYGYFPYASLDFASNACSDGISYGLLPLNACSTDGLTTLPSWFTDNGWDDLLFYVVSSDCTESAPIPRCTSGTLTVGTRTNVNALVISAGPMLLGQSRPNLTLSNYLDSPENADGDDVFDAVGTPLTSTYNDQMFIVAP